MMKNKTRRCCPNCSQNYYLNLSGQHSSTLKNNLPLFLACGHSMCENCISNLVKYGEPIECEICHQDMVVKASEVLQLENDKAKLYQKFPCNIHMIGEITLQQLKNAETKSPVDDKEFFVDLHSILKEGDTSKVCLECHNPTTKMCQQCATILCDGCFAKSHRNFVVFKNHVLKEIDDVVSPSTCKTHADKTLDYYCNDCKKSICVDCLMVGGDKSCKNHDVISMQDVNASFLDELCTLTPKVDETFRRLTKTAYDVGHLLHNLENETGTASDPSQIIANIEQHFSKLCSIVQKHKTEVIDIVSKLNNTDKSSLHSIKDDLTNSIKKAKKVMDSIKMTSNANKMKQMNLAVLLEEAKQIAESPWYLSRNDMKKDPLKVAVNEDLCGLISDYIYLEGNANSPYKLCATAELGEDVEIPPAPPGPVFAPVLHKDVRQTQGKQKGQKPKEEGPSQPTFFKNAPQYRTKSGSVYSINSASSDSSQRSYLQPNAYARPNVQQVQPFPESQHPKQLQEGNQELIYISHIVNPHDFYVQRACHQPLVKDMLRQFRSAHTLPKPSINHVAEGKTYLAYSKADNMWQRCRVVSIDRKDPVQPVFQVFCFDFGSTETVNIEKLRLLPPARVQSPFPLALNCSLANCVPKSGSWTSDDSFLIHNIIDNKQAVIHVRNVRWTSNCNVTLDCDVTTLEDAVSLAHALVFHERANMPDPRLKYPVIKGIREKTKIFMTNDDFKYRTMEEVCITHIVSPDKFYVRKKHQQAVYEQLSAELEQEYSLAVNTGTIYLPENDMPCCVHVPEQSRGAWSAMGVWARAVVTKLQDRGRVSLLLVDSGAPLVAHWTALRYLHPKFAKLSALATECHLAGLTPVNKRWSPQSVALLQQLGSRWLELHVEDARPRASLGVTLFSRADDEEHDICVNQEMIKYKFAITFGINSFNKYDDMSEQVYTNKSPLDKPVRHPKPKPDVQILKRNPPYQQPSNQQPNQPQKIKAADLEAKDKGPLRLEAKVLQYQSPSLVYISLTHQQKTFRVLFEKINKYHSQNEPVSKTNWAVGDRCCTICKQSKTWRRAVIVKIVEDNAEVFYSDFAFVETLPLASLAELHPDFASIGNAAIKCHLCGIIPAVGEEWPSITKEYLKELLDSYPRVFITKVGNFKNGSMPVEIWVYHTIQGSALEPNISEWRCLNKKIVEQGLGVPDKSDEAALTDTTQQGEQSTDLLWLQNVSGSITDWLQLEPMPIKPLSNNDPNSPYTSPTADLEDTTEETFESSNGMFISDWLPPEPFASKEFTGMPTYIDNNGVIYLHDVSQQDTLDLIRKALDVRFLDPDLKVKSRKWAVGEPCVALYFLDNRFYRGRILDVNTETSTCFVHYIDYGNEEHCSFKNLRKSIVLHQVPTQAHRCVLNRIRPNNNKWDRKALDYIHKSIVEKTCHVKVAGDTVDGITPIELKYDKLWINEHLVEFELATYSDGSKAVVKKFARTREHNVREPAPVSDSDPDYIIESDSQDSCEILEDDEQDPAETYVSYPNELDDEFQCHISIIHDPNTLELDIVHDNNTALMYKELFRDLKMEGEDMPAVNGIFKNKACIALFQHDLQWYRASILEYTEAKGKIKVRYVDFGNVEVVDLVDVREIHPDWAKIKPSTVTVQLNGVKLNPEVDINVVIKGFTDTFLDKGPFIAKVITKDNEYPIVELHNEAGELVYQNLIETEVFLKC